MKDRVRTLILHANGFRWHHILNDTVSLGMMGLKNGFPLPRSLQRFDLLQRTIPQRDRYAALSYVNDWIEAFRRSSQLDVEICNINNLVDYRRSRRTIREYPLVIVLHSALGDSTAVLGKTASWFHNRRGKLVVFVGNEYDLIPSKLRFIRESGADIVCSQLHPKGARWLYEGSGADRVLCLPHALNKERYRTSGPPGERATDIGFAGSLYPHFIGDEERTALIRCFQSRGPALGLNCDIRLGNLSQDRWALFLNSCNAVIGAEAGTYYLERNGETLSTVKRYLRSHPRVSFSEVYDRFFADLPKSDLGKAVSSRHFEPMGTRTCQILLEGEYNGILRSGEHYIEVKKDLSNLTEAIAAFRDRSYRSAMIERSFEYAMGSHTYDHRVRTLLAELGS